MRSYQLTYRLARMKIKFIAAFFSSLISFGLGAYLLNQIISDNEEDFSNNRKISTKVPLSPVNKAEIKKEDNDKG